MVSLATAEGKGGGSEPNLLYKLTVEEKWVEVQERVLANPEEARYVNTADNTTALHVAVEARGAIITSSKTDHLREDRISAIGALLEAHPDAACVPTTETGHTPLALACMAATDDQQTLHDDEQIVRMILKHKPESIQILTTEGRSPLDLHIVFFSGTKRQKSMFAPLLRRSSSNGGATTAILRALLECFEYSEAKPNMVSEQLDLLFDCNSLEILENIAMEEAEASSSKLQARRLARSLHRSGGSVSGGSVCSAASTHLKSFWVWDWAIMLLKNHYKSTQKNKSMKKPETENDTKETENESKDHQFVSNFNVMHGAAQVKDCPLPFLMMAMRAYPEDVRSPDPVTGNYPLHWVAAWEETSTHIEFDDDYHSSLACRKSMALSALVSEFPEATHFKNNKGQTPMTLALATGTPWDCGMKKLTAKTSSYQNEPIPSPTASSIGF